MSANSDVTMTAQPARSAAKSASASWHSLYRVASVTALIAALLFLSDFVVLFLTGTPVPASARDWFALLQNDRLVGLLQLFFSDLIGLLLLTPVVLALYAVLRRVHAAYATLAAALGLSGITAVIATNANYGLIYLSDQFAAASTDIQRTQLLNAAKSLLAAGTQGTGLLVASFLVEAALLIFCVIMLQGSLFGRGIAYLGLLAHGLDLAHAVVFLVFIPLANAELALSIATPLLVVGGSFQLIWYPLVARRLWMLAREDSNMALEGG